jgi:hypothetical protein
VEPGQIQGPAQPRPTQPHRVTPPAPGNLLAHVLLTVYASTSDLDTGHPSGGRQPDAHRIYSYQSYLKSPAPFTKRTWTELGCALLSFPLAIAGFVFTVAGICNGPLLAASALGVRNSASLATFGSGRCSANMCRPRRGSSL